MSELLKISNEELAALPLCRFEGEMIVVDSPQSMARAEEVLRGERLLGFDTETRPSFTRGVVHKLSLLQLSTAKVGMLFRPRKFPLSAAVISVLEDEKVVKVGAAIRDDIKALRGVAPHNPKGFVDLQNIVEQWGIGELSVKKMAAVVLGVRLSKAQRLSNWDATSLTHAQKEYATLDAWVCREIFRRHNK